MKKIPVILGLIAFGIAGRLFPHLPNATPINAVALAARRYAGARWAYIAPIAAMLASDAVIGFYDLRILASVYLSFALIAGMGAFAGKSFRGTLLYAVSGPFIFFLTTNFAVWLFSPWYEKSAAGLAYAYALGIPFLRNMFLGDCAYVLVLLGAPYLIAWLRRKAPRKLIAPLLQTP
jgi:hypothetical protein